MLDRGEGEGGGKGLAEQGQPWVLLSTRCCSTLLPVIWAMWLQLPPGYAGTLVYQGITLQHGHVACAPACMCTFVHDLDTRACMSIDCCFAFCLYCCRLGPG